MRMQLPGTFNVYNALAAIKAAGHLGAAESDICLALRSAKVPGRCENVRRSENYVILIDYAHNEMSLKNLLEMRKNRIWMTGVFGKNTFFFARLPAGNPDAFHDG